jgi:hypothetical protein
LISASTIYEPDSVFGQKSEFTTASIRDFFNLGTGEKIKLPTGSSPNISKILDLMVKDVLVGLYSMYTVFGPMRSVHILFESKTQGI